MLVNVPFFYSHEETNGACLLLHGLGGGAYELQLLGQALYEQGLTVRGILYPGHDRPTEPMPASTWPEWYAATLAAFRELQSHFQTIAVIGFSTGATLALHLAHSQPVAKLVLLCPFLRIYRPWFAPLPAEPLVKAIARWVPHLPRRALPLRDPQMRQQAEAAAFFKSFNLSAVGSALDLIAQVETELPTITTPTLILQTLADDTVDPRGAQQIYDQLGSAHKELYWLQRSNHLIPLDYERDDVIAKVAKFLGA
ncbi:alpha/beta hydrolase [Parathermosynechococcus lividus]